MHDKIKKTCRNLIEHKSELRQQIHYIDGQYGRPQKASDILKGHACILISHCRLMTIVFNKLGRYNMCRMSSTCGGWEIGDSLF